MSNYDPSQLDSLKVDELREYAGEAGIEIEDGATKTQIRRTMKAALGVVDDEEDEKDDAPVKAKAPAKKEEAWGNKIVYVFISNQGKETSPVPVSLNGVRIDIPRNKWSAVKEKYAQVLADACSMHVDNETKEVTVQHSYPHQIKDTPPTKTFETPKALSFG